MFRSQILFLFSGSKVIGGMVMIGRRKALDSCCSGCSGKWFNTSVKGLAVNKAFVVVFTLDEVDDELEDEGCSSDGAVVG